MKAINLQKWAEAGSTIIDPTTQQPLVADTVIDTHPVTGGSRVSAPRGYKLRNIGNNTIAVHEGYASYFDQFTRPSALREGTVLGGLIKTEGAVKHGMLLFDSFHLGRVAFYMSSMTHGRGIGASKALLSLDYSDSELHNMERRGELPSGIKADDLISRKQDLSDLIDHGLNIGKVADNIAPNFIRNAPFVGDFNKLVFDKYTRAAIANASLIELARQQKAFPDLSREEVLRKVSRELNTRFGQLQHEGWMKSATSRDLMQLFFLAPGWNEGLLRSEVGAGANLLKTPYSLATKGRLESGALLKSAASMLAGGFAMAQIINYIFRGKPTWQNEEDGIGAKLSAYIPDYIGHGPGFFFNPMTLPAELTHQVMEVMDRGATMREALAQVAGYKVSPIFSAVKTMAAGTDRFGRKLSHKSDIMWEALGNLTPAPISGSALVNAATSLRQQKVKESFKGQLEKQAFAVTGIKLGSVPSPIAQTYQRAADWNKAHGIIRDPQYSTSDYAGLTQALNVNDPDRARDEFLKLTRTKTQAQIDKHFSRQAKFPFTGNKAHERAFFQSLPPEQKDTYRKAVEAKHKLRDDYRALHLQAPKVTP
jgi:hypothetical protein